MPCRALVLITAAGLLAACSNSDASTDRRSEILSSAGPAAGVAMVPLSESEARQRLAARGFDDASDLELHAHGEWTANGTFDGKHRLLVVAPDGAVTAR
jgi:hypothetical protein